MSGENAIAMPRATKSLSDIHIYHSSWKAL